MSLILVDGSALVYRAYYAFINRPLTTRAGEQTSVAFGFLGGVLRLLLSHAPDHLAVVFDVKDPTFRHEIYPDYKANRKPMPEEMAAQLPRLRELLDAWGVAVFEQSGYEADDIMATLARQSAGVTDRAWFYTGDKDFLQLVDERTGLLKPGRRGDEVMTVGLAEVRRRYGLEPPVLVDVFALSGDKSDNIPGAPGVGDKTALKLVQQFGSLDALLANLDDTSLTPRLRRVLEENREQILLSRQLFTLEADVPMEVDWQVLRTLTPPDDRLRDLLEELELRQVRSLLDRVSRSLGQAAAAPPPAGAGETDGTDAVGRERTEPTVRAAPATGQKREEPADGAGDAADGAAALAGRGYVLLTGERDLRAWLARLPDGAPLAVDTETDGLRPDRARLVGVSLAAEGCDPCYVPVLQRRGRGGEGEGGDLFSGGEESSNLDWVRRCLAPVLADRERLKIGQNLKYDEWILTRHDLPLAGDRFDTMVAAYVLDPGRQRYGMDELAADYLGETPIAYADLFGGARKGDILEVPLGRLALYAAEDADVTFRLHRELAPKLAEAGLDRLFREVEMPLSAVLFVMERHGIRVDVAFLGELRERFAAEMADLEVRIHEAAGEEFNVQSPQQLAHVLFEKLGLKPTKRTSTGWSTDVSVLTALADDHPLPGLVLEHRQLAKLQGTYVESLREEVDPDTGLVHTSFNQAVAATGRLSSSDPNLQNIPVRTELGRQIRRAFVPRSEENVFLSADYSQVELRLLAHLSGDASLTAAFREGGDVHRRTAALIAGIAEDEVTPEMRSRAKAINFGVIYGMGAIALGRQIKVTTREAKEFIESYFATYPQVRTYIDAAKDEARRRGYVETLLGRRRHLPDILSRNNRIRSLQERIAVNTPIQGTAADIIKLAMIAIQSELSERSLRSMLLLQVHDELVLEAPRPELPEVRDLVRERMEGVMELDVDLVVDLHEGRNWAEAHE